MGLDLLTESLMEVGTASAFFGYESLMEGPLVEFRLIKEMSKEGRQTELKLLERIMNLRSNGIIHNGGSEYDGRIKRYLDDLAIDCRLVYGAMWCLVNGKPELVIVQFDGRGQQPTMNLELKRNYQRTLGIFSAENETRTSLSQAVHHLKTKYGYPIVFM